MSFSLNRIELIGRLGHEPALRYTAEGQPLTKLSLATDRPTRPGAEPETDWHQVLCWGALAEFAAEHLHKGRLLFVAGRVAYRTREESDGHKRRITEVVARELILLDRRANHAPHAADDGDADALPA